MAGETMEFMQIADTTSNIKEPPNSQNTLSIIAATAESRDDDDSDAITITLEKSQVLGHFSRSGESSVADGGDQSLKKARVTPCTTDITNLSDFNPLNFEVLVADEITPLSPKVLEQKNKILFLLDNVLTESGESAMKDHAQKGATIVSQVKTKDNSMDEMESVMIESGSESATKDYTQKGAITVSQVKMQDNSVHGMEIVVDVPDHIYLANVEKSDDEIAVHTTLKAEITRTDDNDQTSRPLLKSSRQEKQNKSIFRFPYSDGGSGFEPGTPNSVKSISCKSPKVQMALEGLYKAKVINDKFAEENTKLKRRLMILEENESELKTQLESKEQINFELSSQVQQVTRFWEAQKHSSKQDASNYLKKIEEQSRIIAELTDKNRVLIAGNEMLYTTIALCKNRPEEDTLNNESKDSLMFTGTRNVINTSESRPEESFFQVQAFEKLQSEKAEFESLFRQAKEEIEVLNSKKESNDAVMIQNEQYANELEESQYRIKVLESTVASLNIRLVELKTDATLAGIEERRNKLEDMLCFHRQEVTKLQSEKCELESCYKEARDEIHTLRNKEKEFKATENQCSHYADELKDSQYRTKILESTLTELENRVIELKTQNGQLRQEVNDVMEKYSSSTETLETSQYQARLLQCAVADLERREMEQNSYGIQMADQNFQLCREMEKLILRMNNAHQSYTESRNEIKSLQNAINLISSKHQNHVEELEGEAAVLHEGRNIALAQLDENSMLLLSKTEQLETCQNSLATLLKDLRVEKNLIKDLQKTFVKEMKEREAEFAEIGEEIRDRMHESFEAKDLEIRWLRQKLRTERQNIGDLKSGFKKQVEEREAEFKECETMLQRQAEERETEHKEREGMLQKKIEEREEELKECEYMMQNKTEERESEFKERENSLQIRMNDIIDSKNRQINTLEGDVERVLALALVTEQNEKYLKKELTNSEVSLRELKVSLGTEESKRERVNKAWREFEEPLDQVRERMEDLARVFSIHDNKEEGDDATESPSGAPENDELSLIIERATGILPKLSMTLDMAYLDLEKLNHSKKQLTAEVDGFMTKIQAMTESLEKATQQINEQKKLLDIFSEENVGLKQKLAGALAQEENTSFLSEQKLNVILAEKKSLEKSSKEYIEEVERMQEDLAAEKTVVAKLNGDIEELIKSQHELAAEKTVIAKLKGDIEELNKSRHELENHMGKLLDEAISSSSELQGKVELLEKERNMWTSSCTLKERELSENADLKAQLKEVYCRLTESHARLEDSLGASRHERLISKQLLEENEILKQSTKRQIEELDVVIVELRRKLDESCVKNETMHRNVNEAAAKAEERLRVAELTRRQIDQLKANVAQLTRQLEEASENHQIIQNNFNEAVAKIEVQQKETLAIQEKLLQVSAENIKLKEDLTKSVLKVNEIDSLLNGIVKETTSSEESTAEKKRLQKSLEEAQEKICHLEENTRKLKKKTDALSALRVDKEELSDAKAIIGHLEENARKSKTIYDNALSALRVDKEELSDEIRDAEIRIRHMERMANKQTSQSGIETEENKSSTIKKVKKLEEMLEKSHATAERHRAEATALRTKLAALEIGLITGGSTSEMHTLKQERDKLNYELGLWKTQSITGGSTSELKKLKQESAIQEKDLTLMFSDLKKYKARNHQLRDQIGVLKDQLFDAEKKAHDRVSAQDNLITDLKQDKEEMEGRLQTMRRQVKGNQTRMKALEKELSINTNLLLVIKEKLKIQNHKAHA